MTEKEDCPLILRCLQISGIDCRGRDYKTCDYYQKLMKEQKRKKHAQLQKL